MNKITFDLIDGKPVPHVWMMPEKPKDYGSDVAKSIKDYQQTITQAKANRVPVKEEFSDAVEDMLFDKYCNGDLQFKFDLTRDYDVDMEFEIIDENYCDVYQGQCPCDCEDKTSPSYNFDSCTNFVKVAIPKQTKESEPDDFIYKPNYTSEKKYKVEPIKEEKEQTDSEKLRILAAWFDINNPKLNFSGSEVQQDLRQIAILLENQPTESGEGKEISFLKQKML